MIASSILKIIYAEQFLLSGNNWGKRLNMNIYYIDYENVSSQGLKGVELLSENDEVILLYSKKADHVKIDILTMMMESKAKIRFLPVHVGTPNALDFQLVTLLFLNYKPENSCYIISKDSGYDCCIKTAAENGAVNVARYPNIESAVNKTSVKKARRGKQASEEASKEKPQAEPEKKDNVMVQPSSGRSETSRQQSVHASEQPAQESAAGPDHAQDSSRSVEAPDTVQEASTPAAEDTARKKSSRRRGRKKTAAPEAEASQGGQTVSSDSGEKKKDAPGSAALKPAEKPAVQEKEHQADKSSGQGKEKPAEQVLQQRYLSRQFDAKNLPSQNAAKSEADKPVSILSVIRRRNDVQLDMHQIDLIRESLKNSGNKQQFYSYFVKKLGQKQGIELYHSVKSSYTDLVNANLI